MNIQGKIWGTTSLIFSNNNVEIHLLNVIKGGRCSKHEHQSKYNMFHVLSGKLQIEVWKNDYDLIDTTILSAGEETIVKPQEYHRFTCIEPAVALEVYWVTLSGSDIVREDIGCILPEDLIGS